MPDPSGSTPDAIGKTAGRKAGNAGKKAGKKAGNAAAGAAKKLGKKLLSFLKKILLHKPVQYLKIAAKNLYIKITEKAGKKIPELIPEQKVPEKHREQQKNRRGTSPEQLPAPVLAKQAHNNQRIKQRVLNNPGLIDAGSRDEAEIKLVLAGGGTPSTESKQSPDKFFEQLGKEWAALWAYNQYGNNLRNKLLQQLNNPGNGSGGNRNSSSGSNAGQGRGTVKDIPRHRGIRPQRKTGSKLPGGIGGKPRTGDNGSSLAGVAKGTVDTDTGDVDITTSTDTDGSALSQSSGPGLGNSGLTGSNSGSGGDSGGDGK